MCKTTGHMTASGLEFLTKLEGVKTRLYRDCAGYWTIGVGHLLTESELSSGKIMIGGAPCDARDGLTLEQVSALFAQDIAPDEQCVQKRVTVPMTPWQFDALVSFVYNIGQGAFRNSTLLRLLNVGQRDEIPAQFRRWHYAGGQSFAGLRARREAEILVWGGIYPLDPYAVSTP